MEQRDLDPEIREKVKTMTGSQVNLSPRGYVEMLSCISIDMLKHPLLWSA